MKNKVLITTGTTEFKSLMEKAISLHRNNTFEITLQCPTIINEEGMNTFQFTKNIDSYYKNADIIVSHAGAGSCYNLLEMGIQPIVIPNMERRDKHQAQLAKYLEEKNYCLVCWDLKNLENLILSFNKQNFSNYTKTPFSKAEDIFQIKN